MNTKRKTVESYKNGVQTKSLRNCNPGKGDKAFRSRLKWEKKLYTDFPMKSKKERKTSKDSTTGSVVHETNNHCLRRCLPSFPLPLCQHSCFFFFSIASTTTATATTTGIAAMFLRFISTTSRTEMRKRVSSSCIYICNLVHFAFWCLVKNGIRENLREMIVFAYRRVETAWDKLAQICVDIFVDKGRNEKLNDWIMNRVFLKRFLRDWSLIW